MPNILISEEAAMMSDQAEPDEVTKGKAYAVAAAESGSRAILRTIPLPPAKTMKDQDRPRKFHSKGKLRVSLPVDKFYDV